MKQGLWFLQGWVVLAVVGRSRHCATTMFDNGDRIVKKGCFPPEGLRKGCGGSSDVVSLAQPM